MEETLTKRLSSFNLTLKNLTSQDHDDLMILDLRLFVYGGLLLPMAIAGLILNAFTIVVLLHPRMRNSTNVYLTALSMVNIVCLLNFIFLYSLRYLLSYKTVQNNIYYVEQKVNTYESFINLIYRFWSPIFLTFQLYAIYLTCAVTVDRWVYLKWPLKADTICTLKVTIKLIIILFLFCVVFNLSRWFEVDSDKLVSYDGISYYQAKGTDLGRNKLYNLIYQQFGYIIFVYGLPFFVLIVVNIGIVEKLVETEKRKSHLLGNNFGQSKRNIAKSIANRSNVKRNSIHTHKIDPKITFMILAVVVAFFLCQFPYLILHLCAKYSIRKEYKIAKAICDFLAAFNCCINFLIYCFFGQNFRRIAKFILCNPSFYPYNKAMMQRNTNRQAEKLSKSIKTETRRYEQGSRAPQENVDKISTFIDDAANSNMLLNEAKDHQETII